MRNFAFKNRMNYCVSKKFSGGNGMRTFKETNLKGYINYYRKHSYKFASIDPLGIGNKKPSEEFDPEFWELDKLDKVENFPHDTSETFTESVKNIASIDELESHLKNMYMNNVIYF